MIFRVIYKVVSVIVRVHGTDDKYEYSVTFKVCRGVVQGDIISPVLFILTLDQLIQTVDKSGTGVKCDILHLRVLGYADDVALIEPTVEAMTRRLTDLANTCIHSRSGHEDKHGQNCDPACIQEGSDHGNKDRSCESRDEVCTQVRLLSTEIQDRQTNATPQNQLCSQL